MGAWIHRLIALTIAALGVVAAGLMSPVHAATAPEHVATQAISRNTTPQTVFRVSTRDPVFFITIDDGWSHQQAAADYVVRNRIPVTVFLTHAAVQGEWNYFAKVARYGSVQNHSMTHPALTAISQSRRRDEICAPQSIYRRHFGTRPWLLRPPYGSGFMPRRSSTPLIEHTAASCGISKIVLWNAEVSTSGSLSFAGAGFRPGDIVLLHFNGDVESKFKRLVRLYRQHGLRPAPLENYLTRP